MEITAENLAEVLKSSKNIILHGAPGTGKTHLAREIAKYLIDPNYDPKNPSIADDDARIGFVQFHPSYDYTDFVEGLRPVNENGQVVFQRKDGIFKKFCKDAIPYLSFDAIKKSDEFEGYSDEEIAKFKELRDRLKDIERRKEIAEKLKDIYKEFDKEKDKEYFLEKYEEYNAYDEDLKQFFLDLNEFYISIYDAKDTENTFIETYNKEYEMNFGKFLYCDENKKQKESEGWRLLKNKKIKADDHNNTWGSKNNDDICEELINVYRNKPFNNTRKYQRYIADTIINFFSQKQDEVVNIFDKFTKSKTFVFIIDEINRGEISKIFGELFYLIDPDKRGEKHKLKTQYQNLVEDDIFSSGFYIPENVYIIATMNDIDRSVEPIDFAFRRRFTWINVKASDTQGMLDSNLSYDISTAAKNKMKALNDAISNPEIGGLDENYHIGASYFLKLKNFTDEQVEDMKNNLDKYKRSDTYGNDVTDESKKIYDAKFLLLWEYHLEPLLREYLRGEQNIESTITTLLKEYGYTKLKISNNDENTAQ